MLTILAMDVFFSSPTKITRTYGHLISLLDVRPILRSDRQDSLPVPEARRVRLQSATAGTRWLRKVMPLLTMALLA